MRYNDNDYCLFIKRNEISDKELKKYNGQTYAYIKYGVPIILAYFNVKQEGVNEVLCDIDIFDDKNNFQQNKPEVRRILNAFIYANECECLRTDNKNFQFDILVSSHSKLKTAQFDNKIEKINEEIIKYNNRNKC